MELRQLRYFVRVVELGSMGRAALDLGVVTSALSQQISRLESELSTRLLQRTSGGVIPTDAGLAFLQQAQLALRHADDAMRAARLARLSGHVTVGMSSSTCTTLGIPFITAMREHYPDIRLRLVESLSGNLASMLSSRQLDLAVLFQSDRIRRWSAIPLLEERLFLVAAKGMRGLPAGRKTALAKVAGLPLILPSPSHALRSSLEAAAAQAGLSLNVHTEIDGLPMLLDAVRSGLGVSIQPGAALARVDDASLRMIEISDVAVHRTNYLVSLSDDELSPAGLAARTVLLRVARTLVEQGHWPGASLSV